MLKCIVDRDLHYSSVVLHVAGGLKSFLFVDILQLFLLLLIHCTVLCSRL